jgi:hypothetical protein
MALDRFRAAPLPNPPPTWDPQYMRQVIRVLENYFSQLDSRTPNNAQQYSADRFVGGSFTDTDITADNVTTTRLEAVAGQIDNLTTNVTNATYVDTDALHAHSAEITTLMSDSVYGGTFYGNGRFLQLPYEQFTSNQNQTAAALDQAYAITLNGSTYPDGITIVSNSRITFSKKGIYLLTYSISLKNTTNDQQDIDIWLRYKGTNVTASNSRFTIPARKSTGTYSYLIAVTPFMIDITADGDYVEVMWHPSNTSVSIEALPAVAFSAGVTPAIPSTPSVIITVQHISAQFPPVTRVAPLPVFGFGQIGDISVSIR